MATLIEEQAITWAFELGQEAQILTAAGRPVDVVWEVLAVISQIEGFDQVEILIQLDTYPRIYWVLRARVVIGIGLDARLNTARHLLADALGLELPCV